MMIIFSFFLVVRLVPSSHEKTVENEPSFIAVLSLILLVRVMHCLERCAATGLFCTRAAVFFVH